MACVAFELSILSKKQKDKRIQRKLFATDSAPVIVESFKSVTLKKGEAVTLKCSATGSPAPTLNWFLDGDQIFPNRGRFPINSFGVPGDTRSVVSYVNISRAQVDDSGMWSCEAANSAGSVIFSERLNVHGNLAIRPMANTSAVAGKDVVLNCRVTGYPIESTVWSKGLYI